MEYLIVSFTHKNTDIKTREKLSFGNELEKETFLKQVLQNEYINEAMLISTCNRVELIASVQCCVNSSNEILKFFSNRSELEYGDLKERADIYENKAAIYHLFTVASSLDSLVVGETQIAGQLKDAFKFALEKDFAGQKLSRVMNFAFKCAARVRNITQLGTGSVSVASTAVAKAKQLYKDSSGVKALVIGAGEMSELACRHLLKSGFDVVICSRNIKKARVLAHSILMDGNGAIYKPSQIDVRAYEELENLLNSMRLLVTATSAPYPIIKKEMVKPFERERNWFDIALPRDIEEMQIDGVNIYSVDDLQCIVDETLELRASQAKEAFSIVGAMTEEFYIWLKSLSVEPLIKNIRLQSDAIIEKKIQNAIKKRFIKSDDTTNIEKLCKSIMAEFLHTPTIKLKLVSTSLEGDEILGTTQELFGIQLDDETTNNYKEID
ncbi:MAG: glutamyl-tRNA reductase [Arcobacteraceae bacterium]|nr:glutamyl-tRNA reductase [Arcobacteraceae bacterium]